MSFEDIKRLMLEAEIDAKTVSCKTVRRPLHIQTRLEVHRSLSKRDLNSSRSRKRRGIKREYTSSLWSEQVAFYLDMVSFVHKYKQSDQA